MSLVNLPAEIITYIHLLAQNPLFPLAHRSIRSTLSSPPASLVAKYLFARNGHDLDRSLRYPVCTVDVVREMERHGSLTCNELPRRLFRSTGVDPLVKYLFDHYTPSPNSHKGYPLCRAVLTRNHTLAKYLLEQGADPGTRSHLAVRVAIQIGDLEAVRLLVEGKRLEGVFIEWAIKHDDQRIVQYFVSRGMMPNLASILSMKR